MKIKSKSPHQYGQAFLVNNIFLIILTLFFVLPVSADERFFNIQSIDTMKFSRDGARNNAVRDTIPELVKKIAFLKPTHIAIATPYDEEFYPVLKLWVDEARKYNLHIWFRGNFSAWEGWFDYPKYTDPKKHHQQTYAFITRHPELFQDDDIFTPAPEPENGGFGDPRQSEQTRDAFLNFLEESYANCTTAVNVINKKVSCGYFSTNGDVAKMIPKEVVKKIGNRIVIDHYVKDPKDLAAFVEELHKKDDAPVFIGEFGAPIPDIHGDMNEEQQAEYIKSTLIELIKKRSMIEGINYWTAFGGSTSIFNDDLSPRKSVIYMTQYFTPIIVRGTITDIFDQPLVETTVKTPLYSTQTNINGQYEILTIPDYPDIVAEKDGYIRTSVNIQSDLAKEHIVQKDLQMHAVDTSSLAYRIRLIFKQLQSFWENVFDKKQ